MLFCRRRGREFTKGCVDSHMIGLIDVSLVCSIFNESGFKGGTKV